MAISASGSLLQRLDFRHPIIQAPLAGGGDTPDLVAAVSNAGGFGFFGAAYSAPEQIIKTGEAIRSRTQRPFGVNLFAPTKTRPAPSDLRPALDRMRSYYAELNIGDPRPPQLPSYSLEDQVDAALSIGASAFSWTFGLMTDHIIQKARRTGLLLIGTATTVEEAVALERAGADAIVAQGAEAGGHRGSFIASFSEGMIGTISLVPQVADAVRVPVIASGGIMDGRGIAAALTLGAQAVQMGTAFLTCDEAGTPDAHRNAILAAHEDHITTIEVFSGRAARGIRNRFSEEMRATAGTDQLLPFPLQNALTRPLRQAAAKQGRAEFLSLWAGQSVRLARRQSAAQLVSRLVAETKTAVENLNGRFH